MLRVAICEDVLSELQKQTQIIQSIMARLSKNVKFFCFRSGEELLMETDTTGNMDIVFLDVEMLGISGIETARILRERDSRVILIFVSCHNQYCKEMIEVQPYAFIDKPVSEEKLEKILKRVFETHLNSDDSYCFSYNKRQYQKCEIFLLPEWGRIINGNRHHGKYGHRFFRCGNAWYQRN